MDQNLLIIILFVVTSEKMDQILNDENNPWELLDPFGFNHITSPLTAASMNTDSDLELDDLKIPKCADQFVRLLEAMKERYCCLPQPKHQLLFLALQIELIDNFRRRLVQLHNYTVNTSRILNAIFYVNSVLREWGENVVSIDRKYEEHGIQLFFSALFTFTCVSHWTKC